MENEASKIMYQIKYLQCQLNDILYNSDTQVIKDFLSTRKSILLDRYINYYNKFFIGSFNSFISNLGNYCTMYDFIEHSKFMNSCSHLFRFIDIKDNKPSLNENLLSSTLDERLELSYTKILYDIHKDVGENFHLDLAMNKYNERLDGKISFFGGAYHMFICGDANDAPDKISYVCYIDKRNKLND